MTKNEKGEGGNEEELAIEKGLRERKIDFSLLWNPSYAPLGKWFSSPVRNPIGTVAHDIHKVTSPRLLPLACTITLCEEVLLGSPFYMVGGL